MKSLFQKAAYIIGQAIRPTWIELDRSELMAFIGDEHDKVRDPVEVIEGVCDRMLRMINQHGLKHKMYESNYHPFLQALCQFRNDLKEPPLQQRTEFHAPKTFFVRELTLKKLTEESRTTATVMQDINEKHNRDMHYPPEMLEVSYVHGAITSLARKHKIGRYADGRPDDIEALIYSDIPRLSRKHPEDFGLNPASPTIQWAESDRFPGNRHEPNI